VNQQLLALFEEDQADRRGELPDDLHRRDERRRRRVEQLLARGAVTDPDDLFCAAMVFQHGSDRAHYRQAHELARRAAELGSTRPARWLAATALDREQGVRIYQDHGIPEGDQVGRHGNAQASLAQAR
jgi:glycine/D-amino acid oxidase-like deaminating enzyme